MTRFLAAYKREFRVYLYSSHGWIPGIIMLVVPVMNQFRFGAFMQTGIMDLSRLSSSWIAVLSLTVPALTMRSFSEEYRTGADLLLRTLPLSPSVTVLSKATAVLSFIVVFLLLDLVVPLSMSLMGTVEAGLILVRFTGLIMVSMVLVALGVCVSSMTDSQIVALMCSIVFFSVLSYADSVGGALGVDGTIVRLARQISLDYRHAPFVQGLVDGNAILYFFGMTAVLLRVAVHGYVSRGY